MSFSWSGVEFVRKCRSRKLVIYLMSVQKIIIVKMSKKFYKHFYLKDDVNFFWKIVFNLLFVFFHRKKMFVFNNVLSFSLFVRLIGLMIFFVICFYMLRNLFCNQWPTNTIKNCFWYTLYFLENWKDLFFVNDIIYITFFLKQKKRCSFETLGWFLVRKKKY